jgi:hypothetical protein
MTEIDLLTLARSAGADIITDFGQAITITFAMVIGIYYFLNQAKVGLKLFSYLIYSIGMFLYFGEMIVHSNIILGVKEALRALPQDHVSRPTAHYLAVTSSWVGGMESALVTGGYWVLWLSVAYLLFFWRKADHEPTRDQRQSP